MPSASLGIPAPVAPIPGPPQRRRRRVWLWILLPTLAALFLCCCAGPFGLVLYTKDNSLAGTWTLDVPETKKINDNPEVEKASYTYELQKATLVGTAKFTEAGTVREGYWFVTTENGKTVINFSVAGSTKSQKYEIDRLTDDPDRIKVINVDPSSGLPTPCILKRAK
jgi:hypothetical protein